jgi:hypothetical protein
MLQGQASSLAFNYYIRVKKAYSINRSQTYNTVVLITSILISINYTTVASNGILL